MSELIAKKVEDLVPGNLVDLASCPYLKTHGSAGNQYARVDLVERETPECVMVSYTDVDQVGYPVGTELQVVKPKDVEDPATPVRPVGSAEEWVDWRISQNLTDRWGEINEYERDRKPLDFLEMDDALFERLQAQMWDECTFIVRKDGKFGLLYEVEYCSKESEAEDNKSHPDPEWYNQLLPHEELVSTLKAGMLPLLEQFPGVEFCVPHEGNIVKDRPAAWAFMPDGLLNDAQRENLGKALLAL